MNAYLILEDGTVFTGKSIGSKKEVISEIVFNTSMTGYLEVLTDPSYAGQAVVMTYPLIGNYGICNQDKEAKKSNTDAFIVRELARLGSNFRKEESIQQFLVEQDIPGIEGIDTRALTKRLREKGTMNGMITTEKPEDLSAVLEKIKKYSVRGVVDKVTTKEIVSYKPGDLDTDSNISITKKVAILDVGTKFNIARCLLKRGCEVTIYPAKTKAETILASHPDGIMLTNGPGDPKECTEVIEELKKLYASDIPIFAICLGHQLMALACGCDTEKMKYGHRGKSSGQGLKNRTRIHFFPESWLHGKRIFGAKRDCRGCLCKCQRWHSRGTSLFTEKYFHGSVSSGSLCRTEGFGSFV